MSEQAEYPEQSTSTSQEVEARHQIPHYVRRVVEGIDDLMTRPDVDVVFNDSQSWIAVVEYKRHESSQAQTTEYGVVGISTEKAEHAQVGKNKRFRWLRRGNIGAHLEAIEDLDLYFARLDLGDKGLPRYVIAIPSSDRAEVNGLPRSVTSGEELVGHLINRAVMFARIEPSDTGRTPWLNDHSSRYPEKLLPAAITALFWKIPQIGGHHQ